MLAYKSILEFFAAPMLFRMIFLFICTALSSYAGGDEIDDHRMPRAGKVHMRMDPGPLLEVTPLHTRFDNVPVVSFFEDCPRFERLRLW